MTQCQKSLTLRWRSFVWCGSDWVICFFRNNADLYIRFGRMGQCSPLIAQWVRLKIVDTRLTHTLITSKQPLYTELFCAMNDIHIFDIRYCVRMYCRLHPGLLLPLNFWSTDIYTSWVRNDVALSHSRPVGRQLTACRSFHLCLVNIARLPHHSLSSSFSSISMMYHKQIQISQTVHKVCV
jgi:hypothetical protein